MQDKLNKKIVEIINLENLSNKVDDIAIFFEKFGSLIAKKRKIEISFTSTTLGVGFSAISSAGDLLMPISEYFNLTGVSKNVLQSVRIFLNAHKKADGSYFRVEFFPNAPNRYFIYTPIRNVDVLYNEWLESHLLTSLNSDIYERQPVFPKEFQESVLFAGVGLTFFGDQRLDKFYFHAKSFEKKLQATFSKGSFLYPFVNELQLSPSVCQVANTYHKALITTLVSAGAGLVIGVGINNQRKPNFLNLYYAGADKTSVIGTMKKNKAESEIIHRINNYAELFDDAELCLNFRYDGSATNRIKWYFTREW